MRLLLDPKGNRRGYANGTLFPLVVVIRSLSDILRYSIASGNEFQPRMLNLF